MLAQLREIIETNETPELMQALKRLKILMTGGVALDDQLGDYLQNTLGLPLVDGLGMTDTSGALFLGTPLVGFCLIFFSNSKVFASPHSQSS